MHKMSGSSDKFPKDPVTNLRLALRNGTEIDRSIIDYSSLIHIVAIVRNIQIHVGFELCSKRLNFRNLVLC